MDARVPFCGYRCQVQPEWIDHNGHMNVAYYVLAFDQATDAFLDNLHLGPEYASRCGGSVFVVDMNVTYKRELHEQVSLYVTTQLLGHSDKKLHLYHQMFHESEGFLAATNELLLVHVDLESRRSSPFPHKALRRLAAVAPHHQSLERPENVGRLLSLSPPES